MLLTDSEVRSHVLLRFRPSGVLARFAVLRWLGDGPFQDFDSDAGMVGLVTGEVAVGAAAVDLVLTAICHKLEVAHDGIVVLFDASVSTHRQRHLMSG